MPQASPYSLVIHGGAGTIRPDLLSEQQQLAFRNGLNDALQAGYSMLEHGATAIEAVCEAVSLLENNPLFNAGRGAVYTHEGHQELDAAIMDGNTLAAGALAGVKFVKNPIHLARAIMNDGRHVFLSGEGALQFAREHALDIENNTYFETPLRHEQWLALKDTPYYQLDTLNDKVKTNYPPDKKFGTVGAVALDQNGNLAAGTSTGGMCNKKYGRIGDSPVIGAGTYANNNTCAISCTGHGEFFLRGVVAYDISCLMEYAGLSVEAACNKVVMEKLVAVGGEGGLIAIDAKGHIAMPFNSDGMYRGFQTSRGEKNIALFKE
jgi:beta-aspartyl-peptidase (threonine type)